MMHTAHLLIRRGCGAIQVAGVVGVGWGGSVLRGQWRIQDFAEVRAPNFRLRESHQHPILPNFGPRAGAFLAPLLDPPLEVVLYRENDVFICFIYF